MITIKRFCIIALVASLCFSFSACDKHIDFPDTAVKPCHILCTDGKVLPVEDFEQSDKQAIAVVFHINHDENIEGNGYAVYLWDLLPSAFADSLGVEQGTSADVTAFDGNSNTFALYKSDETTSPLAQKAFDLWAYGQSAYIPSVAQMRLLYKVKEYINPIISLCGGDTIPDDAGVCWYWTSTEVKGQETDKAWLYSMGSGTMQETPKLQAHRARPIITLMD